MLPYKSLRLLALFCQHESVYMLQDRERHPNSTVILGGPQVGGRSWATLAFSGVPRRADNMNSGCVTRAFLRAHKWAEVLQNHCILANPQRRGQKSKWPTSRLPFLGPTNMEHCYITPASSEVPKTGEEINFGCITHAFLGAHKWSNCYITPASLGVPTKGDKIQSGYISLAFTGARKWAALLHSAYDLRVRRKRGQNQN